MKAAAISTLVLVSGVLALLVMPSRSHESKEEGAPVPIAGAPTFALMTSDGDGSRLILVTSGGQPDRPSKSVGENQSLPMNVWSIPIKQNVPDFDGRIRVGQLPQAYPCRGAVVACATNRCLSFAYETLWDSGKYLSFKRIKLGKTHESKFENADERVRLLLDGHEVEARVRRAMPLPDRIPLKWAKEFRGHLITNPTPLALFVDGSHRLNLIAIDSQNQVFHTWTNDNGKTWDPAIKLGVK